MNKIFLTAICLIAVVFASNAQEEEFDAYKISPISATYGKKGLNLKSESGNFTSNIGIRMQFRFYTPFDADPRSIPGFATNVRPTIRIRRARLKMKGNAWQPYLKYNFEYDFPTSTLLNAFMRIEKWKGFSAIVGQCKIPYSRERVISSASQTLVERSLVNRAFTVDRQIGVTLYGNFGAERVANFSYWAGIYTGTGILGSINDDDNMMYMGRFQWNFAGKPIDIGEPDSKIDDPDHFRGSIALAGVTNISPYTRFSSSGGSQVDVFSSGDPGQYKVDQLEEDLVIKFKGISLLQEFHYKVIDDLINDTEIQMKGVFAQVGIFPGYLINGMTKKLQFAVRYGYDDENTAASDSQYRDEFIIGANYYMNGFRHRLQTDFTVTNLHTPVETLHARRFRIQWDITF